MKRVKILLTGLAVVTAVGAGLAFKAQRFEDVKLWTSSAINQCRFVTGVTTTATTTTVNQPTVYFTLAGVENAALTTTCTAITLTKTTINE